MRRITPYIPVMALIVLISVLPSIAAVYSWVDGQGTWHFTEDIAKVPAKFRHSPRNKAAADAPAAAESAAPPPAAEASAKMQGETPQRGKAPAAVTPADDKQLYGGKAFEEWRTAFSSQEADLKGLEQQLAAITEQAKKGSGQISAREMNRLRQEQETVYGEYQQKYKKYEELMDAARKAGITVDLKK